MRVLRERVGTPVEDLACDEALQDLVEAGALSEGVLRFWEPTTAFVVVGYGNEIEREVDVAACTAASVPILRRCSGGGTVLQAPGCLNYSLIVRAEAWPQMATIPRANQFVMSRHRQALETLLGQRVEVRGITDLVLGDRKFSGNAQRRKRASVLFHGTFLLEFDARLVSRTLRPPSKEPPYRAGRAHADFLTNIPVSRDAIVTTLSALWGARDEGLEIPRERIEALVQERYGNPAWVQRPSAAGGA